LLGHLCPDRSATTAVASTMIHRFSSRRRGGYSLTVVLLFLVLLLFLWAAVYRTTASFLRVETARVKRNDLDEGMLGALGKALWYLETNPALPRNPVTYGFTATFTPATPPNGWTIQVTPGTYPTPLPGS